MYSSGLHSILRQRHSRQCAVWKSISLDLFQTWCWVAARSAPVVEETWGVPFFLQGTHGFIRLRHLLIFSELPLLQKSNVNVF